MPTITFLTGFEHGKAVAGGSVTPANDRIFSSVDASDGTPTVVALTPRSGALCLDIPTGAGAVGSSVRRPFSGGSTPAIVVMSFAVRFVGSLPTADSFLVGGIAATGAFPGVLFKQSDSTLRACMGPGTIGGTGPVVVPDQWYLVDCYWDVSVSPRVAKMSVDGVAYGDATVITAISTMSQWRLGRNIASTTAAGNIRYDDIVVSETGADYPLGNHEVLKISPNVDGTHSFSAGDFVRGDAGANILTTDTDVYTLIDEAPFGAIDTVDSVQQNVINAAGYVEVGFEAAPRGHSAWAIQTHGQYDADATSVNTCAIKLWDGVTLDALFGPPNGDVSNVDAESFLTQCRNTNPTGGAWTQAAINGIRARFGYSDDVTGSPILHGLMMEIAYPTTTDRRATVSWAALELADQGGGGWKFNLRQQALAEARARRAVIISWAELVVVDPLPDPVIAEFTPPPEPPAPVDAPMTATEREIVLRSLRRRRAVITWVEVEVPELDGAAAVKRIRKLEQDKSDIDLINAVLMMDI